MRVAGVTIPKQKRVVIGLTYVFGVGSTTAEKILEKAQIDKNIRVMDLSRTQ